MLPRKLDDKFRIEKRLKLSGVTGLDKLDRTKDDDRSLNTNYSHVEQEVEFFNDNMHMMYEGEAAEDNADIYDQMDDNFRYDSNLTSSNLAATKNSKHPVEQGEEEDKESVMSELSMQSKYSSMVNFSHDTDNIQHQDYLQDAYSIRTSVGLDAEVDYIVNAFDKVRERISLWQSNAEKEVALAQLIPCPLECGAICKVETMTDHVRDDCPLRTQQCHQCHQIIQFRNVEIHMKQQCPKRIVGCPNSFHGCRDLLHADQVEFHCRLHCHIRMVYCRQFCQVQIPYKDRDMHEQNYCDNRTIQCDQCHTDMLAKEYSSHLLHSCPERILKCGVGCGESFAAKDIAQHEEDVCKQVCCWVNCNQKIGPKWRLQYHEQEECLERPMTCCYECQVPTLTRRTKQNHEVTQCSLRPLPCDLGCGQTLLAKEQLSHIHTYLGSCPERLVRCPSNLVGWRIYLTSTQKEGIVLKYERKYQGQRLQHKYSAFAEDTGGESKAASSIQQEAQYTDEIYVRFVNGHKWLNIWTTDFVLLQYQLQASAAVLSSAASATSTGSTSNQDEAKQHYEQFSCDWIVYSTLTYHLSSDCPHRNVILSNSNDTQHETFGQKTKIQHAVELSELRHAMDQYLDENNADNQISVSCPYCGKDVIREDLKPHLEEACMETTFFCVLGCGEQVRRKDMETHASDLCRKRNVVCPQCNTNDLWAEELDDHIIRYCSHRIVPCPFQCELTTLLAHQSDDHIANHCPLRTVICCCGLSFLSKNLLQHELLDCAYRYVYCPQGCGKQVQHYAVENHTELECPNRHHIYQKMTECPNGCGEVMMKKELLEHCTYNCEKRIVECPQKCGNTTPLDLLKGKSLLLSFYKSLITHHAFYLL